MVSRERMAAWTAAPVRVDALVRLFTIEEVRNEFDDTGDTG